MDEQIIHKLKVRMVRYSLLAFLILMGMMGSLMYLLNTMTIGRESEKTLDYIIANEGDLTPAFTEELQQSDESDSSTTGATDSTTSYTDSSENLIDRIIDDLEKVFSVPNSYDSPEFAYSTRYFAVIFDENGETSSVKTGHIAAIDQEEAVSLARMALSSNRIFNRIEHYYYKTGTLDDGSTIVAFLDSSDMLNSNYRLLISVGFLIVFGMLVSSIVLIMISGRFVRPEIRNMENQKRFITNASHELKTPLAVIRANTELTEMTSGETEWTQSTLRQVERLEGLIQNLVSITRAQEKDSEGPRIETDCSKAVRESVKPFNTVAMQEGKQIETQIPDGVTISAHEGDIRQLTSLLTDNAVKYCDDGGTIRITLSQGRSLRNRNMTLVVSNPYAAGKNVDYQKFFERFYRGEESHDTNGKNGFGIGLSMAQNICEMYRGSIQAKWNNGVIYFTCVLNG